VWIKSFKKPIICRIKSNALQTNPTPSGLRLSECLRLQVKDIDFGYKKIIARYLIVSRAEGFY